LSPQLPCEDSQAGGGFVSVSFADERHGLSALQIQPAKAVISANGLSPTELAWLALNSLSGRFLRSATYCPRNLRHSSEGKAELEGYFALCLEEDLEAADI